MSSTGKPAHRAIALIAWIVVEFTRGAADAQEPPPPDAGTVPPPADAAVASGPQLVAPQLLEAKDAVYPADAAPDQAPAVVLRLTIEADGSVTGADIVESAGASFDAAAREAALQFRFSPATRDGVPLAARILYRLQFTAPAPAAPPPATPAVPPPAAAPTPTPPLPAPAVSASAVQPVGTPQEILVAGEQREVDRHEQSAEALTLVKLKRARRESSALGEVLSRVPGVSIRRAGGLGSGERLSLNGLSDDRVATFLDGVPLELAYFPFSVASFPVNLADRVEIYKGIVPIRFGAHALGGAINIVSDKRYETGVGGSVQVGSFGERRFTAHGAWRHEPSGFVITASGFHDYADNDYEIDVEAPDERGRLEAVRVPRFHDAYLAYGANVEVAIVDVPWARRLSLRGFAVALDKELQHNIVMTVPYGEARYGRSAVGANVEYDVDLTPELALELWGAYAYQTVDFVDKAEWVYDWFGERVRERNVGGEIERDPKDQTEWWHIAHGRAVATYHLNPVNVLTFVTSPTFATLTGDERIQANPDARDPLTARRQRTTVVSGLEHELNAFRMPDGEAESATEADYRFQNLFFVKHYYYYADSEEPLPGGVFRDREIDRNRFGIGDGIRYRFTRELQLKASYEYATRLPRVDEVFGDGMLIHANLLLEPETSHNANLGTTFDWKRSPIGDLKVEVNGFFRDADELIVLLGGDRFFTHENVYTARALGVENQLDWNSPGRYVAVEGTLTFQDFRNTSTEGTFRDLTGDRIPNRPWLFASWGARLHFERLFLARDELEPFYVGRYVHEYFRGWESQGLREYKQTIDSQVIHGIGITYVVTLAPATLTATLEVQNLLDAKNYDFFGVQKPGRAIFLKVTGDLR